MASAIGALSLEEQLGMAEKAKEYANQQLDAYKDMVDLTNRMQGHAKEYLEHGKDSLVNMSRISEVMTAHSTVLKTNIALQKDAEEIERKIRELKKQQNDEAEKAVELSKVHTDKLAKSIGEGVVSPMKGVSNIFAEMSAHIPMFGTALLALSPILNELAGRLSSIREITRTGGLGAMEGMGGLGGMASLSSQMSMATLSVPFFKESYGSKSEIQQGVGTMFGMGGIRGQELLSVMDTLPKQAHEMGLSFGDAAQIMSKMHRVLKESPTEMKDSLSSMAEAAKDSGMAVKDFAKAVADTSMIVAHYGLSIDSVTEITKKYAHLISEESVSRDELARFILMEAKAKRDDVGIMDDLSKATAMATAGGYRVADSFKIQEQVTQTLIPVVKDASEALKLAGEFTPRFTKAIVEGRMQLETLTGVLPDLVSKYHFSERAIEGWSEMITNMAKSTGVAAPELAKDIIGVSNSLSKMFADPGQGLVLATSAVGSFARMLKTGQMSTEDFTKVMKSNMDTFGMSGSEAKSQFSTLADVVQKTNVRMEELSAYTAENAKINKQYGYDLNSSTALLVTFNEQIRAGALSVQDLQMMAKGPAGTSEGFRALMAQNLGQAGGQLGRAFSGGDVMTQIEMLRDLQESFASGTPSKRMQRHGITNVTPEMEKTYNKVFRDTLLNMTGGSIEESETMFKKMSPQIMGAQFSGVGGAAESFWEMISKGRVNIGEVNPDLAGRLTKAGVKDLEFNSMRELSEALTKLVPKENTESYFSKFGKSSDKLYDAAKIIEDVYKKALADRDAAEQKKKEEERKFDPANYQGLTHMPSREGALSKENIAYLEHLNINPMRAERVEEGRQYAKATGAKGTIDEETALKAWAAHAQAMTQALDSNTKAITEKGSSGLKIENKAKSPIEVMSLQGQP